METIIKRDNISPREDEIMEKVTFRELNKGITDDLECRTNTNKKHLKHIFTKLNYQNRTEASSKFMEIADKFEPSNE